MYDRSAKYYDAIYKAQGKDYGAESQKLRGLIEHYQSAKGAALLDAACGTGGHLVHLESYFDVEGLDLSEAMLQVARSKLPGVRFHQLDMVDFKLDQSFDVILCLFSAIGYALTVSRLNQTIKTFANHLKPEGLVIVEPWFGPGMLDTGKVHASFVDEPDLKLARMNINRVEGTTSYLDFHYLAATPQGMDYFMETHAIGLFTTEEYRQAFQKAGLRVEQDEEGLDGRGLYIGIKES